jgi:hypothetical protein
LCRNDAQTLAVLVEQLDGELPLDEAGILASIHKGDSTCH